MDPYRTLAGAGEGLYEEKRSRFLGAALPVADEAMAQAWLQERRRAHWNARHTAFAYILRGGLERASDDGEPQGTAGAPLLAVLRGAGVCDCLVAVTRYFGGVLLGTGGLTRAYAQAGKQAVEQAGVTVMRWCVTAVIDCTYAQQALVTACLTGAGARVLDTQYTDRVRVTFALPVDRLDALRTRLIDASAGTLSPAVTGEGYAPAEES